MGSSDDVGAGSFNFGAQEGAIKGDDNGNHNIVGDENNKDNVDGDAVGTANIVGDQNINQGNGQNLRNNFVNNQGGGGGRSNNEVMMMLMKAINKYKKA